MNLKRWRVCALAITVGLTVLPRFDRVSHAETWVQAIENKNYEGAERDLRGKLAGLTGEERNACLFALGFVLAKQGRPAESRAEIAAIDPKSPWAEDGRFVLDVYARPRPPHLRSAGAGGGPPVVIMIREGPQMAASQDRFSCASGKIHRNGRPVESPYELPASSVIDGRSYRGRLEIVLERGRLVLLNTVPVEEYLYGVLKNEIGPDWPPEALKAQAIASRTFVLRRLDLAKSSGNGPPRLASDVSIQVYRGRPAEDPRVMAVVDATRGEVLTYRSELIEAVFHSESGGVTESSAELWGRAYPYLISKPDAYGGTSPKNKWEAEFTEHDILHALDRSSRAKIGRVRSVEISDKTSSGRAKSIRIAGTRGSINIPAGKYRLSLGPDRLRSLLWTDFEYVRGRLRVSGLGWGHGVGLSQWSAKAAAEKGLSCEQILQLYFPGTKIETRY